MLICVQRASSLKQSIIPVMNREDGNCAANTSRDELPKVLAQLRHISQHFERHIINVNLKLSDIQQRMTDVEKCLQERSFPSQMHLWQSLYSQFMGAEQLIAEHRVMLHRSPLVSDDEQWLLFGDSTRRIMEWVGCFCCCSNN